MDVTKPNLPRTGAEIGSAALRVELDTERKIRTRNKLTTDSTTGRSGSSCSSSRPAAHVRSVRARLRRAPADVAERGADWHRPRRPVGKLPGCEPAPYIIRFTEDRPNPLYRRICYTTAWGESSLRGTQCRRLLYAIVTGEWR
jgi:hypothetical protein